MHPLGLGTIAGLRLITSLPLDQRLWSNFEINWGGGGRGQGGGRGELISDSILGGSKTLFVTHSLKF